MKTNSTNITANNGTFLQKATLNSSHTGKTHPLPLTNLALWLVQKYLFAMETTMRQGNC
jgi:hypothetical protein